MAADPASCPPHAASSLARLLQGRRPPLAYDGVVVDRCNLDRLWLVDEVPVFCFGGDKVSDHLVRLNDGAQRQFVTPRPSPRHLLAVGGEPVEALEVHAVKIGVPAHVLNGRLSDQSMVLLVAKDLVSKGTELAVPIALHDRDAHAESPQPLV
eukprot:6212517-Pleurochrysis_carterae.AAC.14